MARALIKPNPENASLAQLHETIRCGSYETQRRCMAIIMLISGSDREQVQRAMQASSSALRKWIRDFNASGIDGLIAKKRCGAPRKIPHDLMEGIVQDLEKRQEGEEPFPSAKAFHGYVTETYQVECSYQTLLRMLHENNYAFKVPQPWPDRQDEQQRQAFRAKLAELQKDDTVDLWFADETGVEGDPRPRRRLARKGSKPRCVKNGDHTRLSIIGNVCPRTGEFFAIEASHCDTAVFQAFLDEAARSIQPTRKRNFLILDNASWHKRKSLNWHFFEPLFLPPYSPDFNPIERLWLVMKAKWFANYSVCQKYFPLFFLATAIFCDKLTFPKIKKIV